MLPGGQKAKVRWPGAQRMKPNLVSDLRVMLILLTSSPIPPTEPGQPVVVEKGDYAGRRGTIQKVIGHRCIGKWTDSARITPIDMAHVHAKTPLRMELMEQVRLVCKRVHVVLHKPLEVTMYT